MEDLVEQVLAERRRRPHRGLMASLVGAAVLHVLGVAAMAFSEGPEPPTRPKEYVAVKAVPLSALGRPDAAPPRPAPTKPNREVEPKPEPEPPKSAPVLPTPKPKPEPKAAAPKPDTRSTPPPATSVPVPVQAEPQEDAPQGIAGSEQGTAAGTSAFGTHRLEGIDPDFTYDYYLDRMLALIHRQWERPATLGDVQAVVRFVVQKSGEITELELAEPSGSNAFDLAALRAVRNANPLPRLPASYRRGALAVTLIVRGE